MAFFKSLAVHLGQVLVQYGGWGLLGISFFDATILSFPLLNDLVLIHLAGQSPALAPLYALGSTAGSVLGYFLVYALARGGVSLVRRKGAPEAKSSARLWVERNDFIAILVTSLLPPPVPFKPFVVTAGLLRMNALRYGLALGCGRGLRFAADAWLGARYGARAETYFKNNLGWASLVVMAVLVGMTLLYRLFSSRQAAQSL